MKLPDDLQKILSETPALRRAYLVGGCVRDSILGLPQKDYDVEVYSIAYEDLQRALARWGSSDLVGRSFGVIKLSTPAGATYDFSIPRRDSKTTSGHKGFTVQFDPDIQPQDAAALMYFLDGHRGSRRRTSSCAPRGRSRSKDGRPEGLQLRRKNGSSGFTHPTRPGLPGLHIRSSR